MVGVILKIKIWGLGWQFLTWGEGDGDGLI